MVHFNSQEELPLVLKEKLVNLTGTIPSEIITHPLVAPGIAEAKSKGTLQGTQTKALSTPGPPKFPGIIADVIIVIGLPPYTFTTTPSGQSFNKTPHPSGQVE